LSGSLPVLYFSPYKTEGQGELTKEFISDGYNKKPTAEWRVVAL